MKRFVLGHVCFGLVLAYICDSARSADSQSEQSKTNNVVQIKAAAAKENIGKEAVVSGTVVEVNKAAALVRLNLEKAYPKQPFTAVIFARNTNQFGDFETFKGKKIEVTGKITEYNGRPQIVLT